MYKLTHNFDTIISPFDNEFKTRNIYFGLAHGISGVINFLFYLSQHIKSLELEIKQAILKLINFMRSKKSFNNVSQQYYPNYIDSQGNISQARLGWCQGDLGIGLALYNASILLEDNQIKEEGIALINSTEKISLQTSNVYDCGLCHGSAGLLIQYYLAQEKCSLDTKETQNRWYHELEKQTSNFTTFKAYLDNNFFEQSNIIGGAAGLGLVFLTRNNKIESDWLRCLNLY